MTFEEDFELIWGEAEGTMPADYQGFVQVCKDMRQAGYEAGRAEFQLVGAAKADYYTPEAEVQRLGMEKILTRKELAELCKQVEHSDPTNTLRWPFAFAELARLLESK